MIRALIALGAALAAACSHAELRGACSVAPERLRGAALGERFVPLDCRDAAGKAADAPALIVRRVMLTNGRDALVEQRPGHDSVIVANVYDQNGERIYAYIADDGEDSSVLHVLVPKSAKGAARLVMSSDFEASGSEHDFRGSPRQTALRCALASAEKVP